MSEIERRVLTLWCVLSSLVLGGALAGAGFAGRLPTALVLAAAGLVTAYGWPRLLGLPSPRGVLAVLVLATAAAVGATFLGDGRDLRWVPVGLAMTLVASFLHQLLRKDGRARLVTTLGGTALGAGLIAAGACFVGARSEVDGPLLVVAAVLAVVVSTALDWVLRERLPDWALPLSTGFASALAAGLAVADSGPVLGTFLVAVAACVVAHAVRRLLTVVPTAASDRSQVTIGAAALLATGPVPYAGAWLIEWFASR